MKAEQEAAAATAMVDSDLAGSKLRKQQMAGSFRESVSAPVSDFARKHLEKMGWKEGTGLGKKRNGMKSHIKVVKRQDSAGLGTEKAKVQEITEQNEWWKDSLGDTLAKLAGHHNNTTANSSSKKKKKTTTKKRYYTDEELFEATGGARFGMRAGKTRNLAKWRRTESSGSVASSSVRTITENTTTSTSDEPVIVADEEKSGSNCSNSSSDEAKSTSSKDDDRKKKKKKDQKKSKKRDRGEARTEEEEEQRKEKKRLKKEEKKRRQKKEKKVKGDVR